jgi:hypothetical protein
MLVSNFIKTPHDMPNQSRLSPIISIIVETVTLQLFDLLPPLRFSILEEVHVNVVVEIVDDTHLGIIGKFFNSSSVVVEVLVAFFADHLTLTVHDGANHENLGIFVATF